MPLTTEATVAAVGVYCNVCWETHDVHSIYVLPCGHGYCANVLKNQTRKPPHPQLTLCPHCKQECRPTTRRRVFLDLRVAEEGASLTSPPLDPDYHEEAFVGGYSNRAYQQAENAAVGIAKLDADSPVASIRRAASEIRKVTEKMNDTREGGDKIQALLNSMSAFITRIGPLWGTQNEVAALRQQLNQRRNKIADLEDQNHNASRIANEAVETAERVQSEYVKVRGEKDTLQARLEKAEEDAKERTSTMSRLQDSIASYKKRDAKYMAKIQALEAQLEQQRKQIAALEEASTTAAEEKLALESQLQMGQAPCPPDSEHDASDDFDDMYLDLDAPDARPSSEASFPGPEASSSTSRKPPLPAPPPQRPKFGSAWNLKLPTTGKRKRESDTPTAFPIVRDSQGRASKPVALGSRMKLHRHN